MNILNRSESRSYDNAKEFIRKLDIKTQRDYSRFITGKTTEYNLPGNPRNFYKEFWVGWGDYLSTNRIALINREFYSYDEIKNIIKENSINSKREYNKFYKKSIDNLLPSNPDKVYKSFSWYNILNKQKQSFLTFEEGRIYSRSLNIKSVTDYCKYIKVNNINFLPITPDKVYKNKWTNWMDWLDTDNISKRISKGHIKIQNFLNLYNILYIDEKSFKDCVYINKLYYDFYLEEYNICIEFDGIQHYKPVDRFGGENGFITQIIKDKIKDDYCLKNNIKLIRISYLDIKSIEDIIKKELIDYVQL